MRPRFVGRFGLADAVTVANAMLGFVAVVVTTADPRLGARLLLLAAIADGLDGVVARKFGGTPAGPYLDSLADVASFGVAPAMVVFVVARESWGVTITSLSARSLAVVGIPALFVAMAVARLGLYTAYDTADEHTVGVPTTLAATIVGAAVVAGITDPTLLLAATAAFVYLMVSPVRYPDLLARDALLMGVVHALAVLVPDVLDRAFPYALLTLGLAYMLFGPWLYWRGDWLLLKLKGNA